MRLLYLGRRLRGRRGSRPHLQQQQQQQQQECRK
jgi:hypothetical protein